MTSTSLRMIRQLVCLLAGSLLAASASAQMKAARVDPPPPPAMQAFDPSLEPQVTIHQTQRGTESEYRIRGKLYMVKVVPLAGGAAYYLLDQTGEGKFVRSDNVGPSVQPPMWVVGTF